MFFGFRFFLPGFHYILERAMKRSLLLPLLVSLLFAGFGSCDPSPEDRPGDEPLSFFAAQAGGAIVLDLDPVTGVRVIGLPLPAPERATVRALFHGALMDSAGEARRLPVEGPVQDVRLGTTPSREPWVAVLDAAGKLWLWETSTARVSLLAEGVFPGFAFSPDGRHLAYTAGMIPEMDLYVVSLDSRQVVRLTDEDGPVWGPAFSPDGAEVAFVSSRGGYPSLAVVSVTGGSSRRITNADLPVDGAPVHASQLAPFPDGRRPPLWTAEGLVFENGEGVFRISPAGQVTGRWPGARFPVLSEGRLHGLEGPRLVPLGTPEVTP
jgi:hypothetical protein